MLNLLRFFQNPMENGHFIVAKVLLARYISLNVIAYFCLKRKYGIIHLVYK